MRFLLLLTLSLVCSLVVTLPERRINLHLDDFTHEQDSDGDAIEGTYRFMSPEGTMYFVHYIADQNGYRILDSNAVPANNKGVLADGHQGSFVSLEDDSEYDDDDDDKVFRRF